MDDQQYQETAMGSGQKGLTGFHSGSLFIGLVLGLIIGGVFGVVTSISNIPISILDLSQGQVQAQHEAALRARLEERGVLSPSGGEPMITDTISGEVMNVSGDNITVKVVPFDILAPDLMYKIVASSDTKVTYVTMKDYETIQAEMEAFSKRMQEESTDPAELATPPSPNLISAANISDVAVGNRVTIVATENITESTQLLAKEIQIIKEPKMPDLIAMPMSEPMPETPATEVPTPLPN